MTSRPKTTWLGRSALAVLLLGGVLAGIALAASASRYVEATRAVGLLDVEVTGFRLVEDRDPHAELALRLTSTGPIAVFVERFTVELTLDGFPVASSQSDYAGVGRAPDPDAYTQPTSVGQIVGAGSPWEGNLTLYVEAPTMEAARTRLDAGAINWGADVGIFITLPFSTKREHLVRPVTFAESPR